MALVRLGTVRLAVARISLLSLGVLGLVSPAEAQFGWVKSDELVSPTPNIDPQDSGHFEITDVSANGDVVVVGAPNQHLDGFRRGAVYIYRRTGQGPLVLEGSFPGAVDNDFFGSVVRVSGDGETVVARHGDGSAVMYRRTAGVWAEFPTSSAITIGLDITTDGSRIFQGIDHNGANWSEISPAGIVTGVTESWAVGPIDPQEFLNAQSPVTRMAPDGRTIVVGTPYAGGGSGIPGAGIAYVLSASAEEWQITKLLASDDFPEDQFGAAVVVSNDGATVVVSAPNKFVADGRRGKLYVFTKDAGAWQPTTIDETQQVPSPVLASFTGLGSWMSGLGNGRFVAVGANSYPNSSILILDRLSATSPWTRITPPVCDGNTQSRTAVMSDDARTVVIGAPSCFVPNGVVVAYRGFAKPTIDWRPPSSIEYGTALSAEQFMNATADVPGTFAYSLPAGTIPEPNAATIWLTFTPQDTLNYMPVTEPRIVHVTPRPTTLQWPAPAPIHPATTLSVTQLNASADASGFITYTPALGTRLDVGTHTLKAVFTPHNPLHHAPAETTVQLTVSPLPAPTGFEATVGRNLVTFRWQRPPGISDTDFLIEGGVLPGQTLATFATPSGATSRSFPVRPALSTSGCTL